MLPMTDANSRSRIIVIERWPFRMHIVFVLGFASANLHWLGFFGAPIRVVNGVHPEPVIRITNKLFQLFRMRDRFCASPR